MAQRAKIIQLRQLLAERGLETVARPRDRFAVGWRKLDEQVGGGLPKGDIAELHSKHAGSALALAWLIHSAEQEKYFLALVDGADGFDPASVTPEALTRLLWVRCHSAIEAVKAADLLLRDGNLPLVLMDLRGSADAVRIPSQNWYRLQRIVEQSGAALLVFTPRPLVPSARVRVALEARFSLDDLDREQSALVPELQFKTGRVQGARFKEPYPLAEVG